MVGSARPPTLRRRENVSQHRHRMIRCMSSAPAVTTHKDAVRSAAVVIVAMAALVSTLSTLSVFWTPRAGLGVAVSGTTITGVAPGSMAARAGIRPGDRLDPAYGFAERAR